MNALEIIGYFFAIAGGAIFLAAGIGLLRLRDVYTRTSSVATAAGLGVAFVVAGTALIDPTLVHWIKVVIAIALQLATSAIGGIMIARSAVLSGHPFDATDTRDLDEGEVTGDLPGEKPRA